MKIAVKGFIHLRNVEDDRVEVVKKSLFKIIC